MQFEYGGCAQPARHAGPRGLLRGHVPHARRAVDSAVMLIDAAKGVEARTRKLFEVCRLRGIPIFTFVNKLDREGARSVRSPRRDREDARPRHRAGQLADRPAAAASRASSTSSRSSRAAGSTRSERTACRLRGRSTIAIGSCCGRGRSTAWSATEVALAAGGRAAVRPERVPRGPSDAGVLRHGAAQFRRPRPPRRSSRPMRRRPAARMQTSARSIAPRAG